MQQRSITTIRNQVYQILKEDICSGKYPPGYWLQEKELATQLSVSRSPVREALHQLCADGLVMEYPNKGVYVKEFTPRDIREVFDLRVLMENYAMTQLRSNLSSTGITQLLDCMLGLEKAYKEDNLRLYTDYDAKLHNLLIRLSGNTLLESMYERVFAVVQQFRIYSLMSRKRFDESTEEHRLIIDSLIKGDTALAQETNLKHLNLARETILRLLEERADQGKDAPLPAPPETPI